MAEEKANQREKSYKENIKNLTVKLKQAEARAEFADKSIQKLQKEVGMISFREQETMIYEDQCLMELLKILAQAPFTVAHIIPHEFIP